MRSLRLNQKQALAYSCKVLHPAFFMEMRLGKTLVTIRWAKYRRLWKNLIIGPYSVYKGWRDELALEDEEKWGVVPLFGTREERLHTLEMNYDTNKWFFLNKEGHLVVPEITEYLWDAVIIDESTCIKSHDSQITKFYSTNFRDVLHRCILTGTPAPESETDYFSQLKFLDSAIFRENNFWEFKRNNFGTIGFNTLISPRGSKYLSQRLAQYCFFQTRADVNLGGEKIYEKRYVQMSSEMKAMYKKIAKDFMIEIDGKVVDATVYAHTKYLWLRRLCGGFVDGKMLFGDKVTELVYLLRTELKNQQVVVWCRFTDEIEYLSDYLTQLGFTVGMVYGKIPPKNRPMIQEAFQKGSFDIFLLQPGCFKYGVNLSCASTMIYYSTPESGETRQQSEDRTIDVSLATGCLIIDLIVEDSLEEDILLSLRKKESNQSMMRRIVQRMQKELI